MHTHHTHVHSPREREKERVKMVTPHVYHEIYYGVSPLFAYSIRKNSRAIQETTKLTDEQIKLECVLFGGPRCHSIYRYQNDEQAYRKQLEQNRKFKSHWTMENSNRSNGWMNEPKCKPKRSDLYEKTAKKPHRKEKQEQRFSFRPTDWLTDCLTN